VILCGLMHSSKINGIRGASHYGYWSRGQCDWWRAKVCMFCLHTKGQQQINNALQNAYMIVLFVSFVCNTYKNPNSP
jgi:hypothetical protein